MLYVSLEGKPGNVLVIDLVLKNTPRSNADTNTN